MFQCPLCHEYMLALTTIHASKHNMTRDELKAAYGQPKYAHDTRTKEVNEWLRKQEHIITELDFALPQGAVRGVVKR